MPAGRPNVLFIMTDQMRADCMSGVGHPVVRTPHLDQLASEGVLFRRAYVQSAVCGPSRMCFYTGRYPHANRSPWNEVPLPADEKTMGHFFGEAGYRAALCGKTHYTPDPFGDPAAQPEQGIHRAALAGLETWELNESRGRAGWPISGARGTPKMSSPILSRWKCPRMPIGIIPPTPRVSGGRTAIPPS